MYVGAYETSSSFKFNESFYNMRCLVMFITAICLLIFTQNKTLFQFKAQKNLPKSWILNNSPVHIHYKLAEILLQQLGGSNSSLCEFLKK